MHMVHPNLLLFLCFGNYDSRNCRSGACPPTLGFSRRSGFPETRRPGQRFDKTMKYQVTIGEKKFEVDINGNDPAITVNGRKVTVDYKRFKGGKLYSLLADNVKFEFDLERSNGGYDIWHSSGSMFAEVVDEKTNRLRKLMGETGGAAKLAQLKAPMPGLVVAVQVEPGQEVKRGDGLVIVEAMKMENELKATGAGKVKEIKVKQGQAVEKGEVLVVFE